MQKPTKQSLSVRSSGSNCKIELELPADAIAQLGRGMVEDLVFSADSQHLAVAARTGLWWYLLPSMSPTTLWETERGMVSAISCSADGKWFTAGNYDGILKLWDIQSDTCFRQLGVQNDVVTPLGHTFSSDGRYLAIFSSRTDAVHIVNPADTTQFTTLGDQRSLKMRRPGVQPLAFSPDNQLLASVSPTEDMSADFVSVWHLETKERIAYFTDYSDYVYGLSFSPCGRFLSIGCWGGILRVWDVFARKLEMAQIHYGKYRMYPCYSLEGKLLVAALYHYHNMDSVDIWDVANEKKLDEIEISGRVSCARFSACGTQLAVASGGEIKVRTLEKQEKHISSSIRGHTGVVESIVFSPDGKTLAAGYQDDHPRHLWNIENFCSQRLSPVHTVDLNHGFHSLPGEKTYYANQRESRFFKIWDMRTAKCLMEWSAPEKPLWRTFRLSPKADLLVGGHRDGSLSVWEVGAGKRLYTLTAHTRSVLSTAFSPDGMLLVSTSVDRTIRVWDVRKGKEVGTLPNYSLLNTAADKSEIPEILKDLKPSPKINKQLCSPIVKVVFSPCGTFVAGGLSGEIRLWNVTTYDILMAIALPSGCQRPYALAFSPCGRYLTSGSWWQGTDRMSIRLWDVVTGNNIATFWGHPTDVQDLAFSPDGTLLASASFDGTILLWDMKPYLPHET